MAALTAAMGVASLGGAAAFGCSSSSGTEITSDGGPDVTTDTKNDVVVVNEAGADVTDAGSEAADANDAADVADGDGGPVAPAALTFAQNEATTLCTAYKSCCEQEDASPGGFDLANCATNVLTYGWEGNLASQGAAVYASGHVAVDQAKAAQCLQAIANFPCPTQTAAQWSAITSACELVLTGTIALNGTGCQSSFECANGTFCDTSVDGGVCHPLATQGQPCDTVIHSTLNPIPDQMCSYLGSGQPALYCDLIDPPTSANFMTCQPVLDVDASCANAAGTYYDDQACVSTAAVCGLTNRCGSTTNAPYSCLGFPVPVDAGGGG